MMSSTDGQAVVDAVIALAASDDHGLMADFLRR
jgi:hypothetical protein